MQSPRPTRKHSSRLLGHAVALAVATTGLAVLSETAASAKSGEHRPRESTAADN